MLKSAFVEAGPSFNLLESIENGMNIYGITQSGYTAFKTAVKDFNTDYASVSTTVIGWDYMAKPCNVPQSLLSALDSANLWLVASVVAHKALEYPTVATCVVPADPLCWAAVASYAASGLAVAAATQGVVAATQAINEWKQANCK